MKEGEEFQQNIMILTKENLREALGLMSNIPETRTSEHTPLIPALERLRQGYQEFKNILGYMSNSRPPWDT